MALYTNLCMLTSSAGNISEALFIRVILYLFSVSYYTKTLPLSKGRA